MSQQYSVKPGDFMAKIANQFQITDYNTIWNDSHNASLKKSRTSPNVLMPGDSVYIPDKAQKQETRATDARHVFQVGRQKPKLVIVLQDAGRDPIAGTPYKLKIDGSTAADDSPTKTDGSGKLTKDPIALDARTGLLKIRPAAPRAAPPSGCEFEESVSILIAELHPVTYQSGQLQRLNNLGYRAGTLKTADKMDNGEDLTDEETKQFESAVEEFQCDYMGKPAVDGDCGKNTQAKLLQVHGC